jgi:hypothetical protein
LFFLQVFFSLSGATVSEWYDAIINDVSSELFYVKRIEVDSWGAYPVAFHGFKPNCMDLADFYSSFTGQVPVPSLDSHITLRTLHLLYDDYRPFVNLSYSFKEQFFPGSHSHTILTCFFPDLSVFEGTCLHGLLVQPSLDIVYKNHGITHESICMHYIHGVSIAKCDWVDILRTLYLLEVAPLSSATLELLYRNSVNEEFFSLSKLDSLSYNYPDMVFSITNTELLGQLVYTHNFFILLVISLLLLVSMIGSIVTVLNQNINLKRQLIFRQTLQDLRGSVKLKR